MARPTGVTVIAVIDFIGAGFFVLAGIGALVGASFLGAMFSQAQTQGAPAAGGFMAMLGGAISIILLIAAAIGALIGWGMLTLKGWARIVQIIFAALGALNGLRALLHFNLFSIVVLAYDVWVIWYLLQPQVAAAFAEGQARSATA